MKYTYIFIVFAFIMMLVACDPVDQGTEDVITTADLAGNWTCYEKSDLNGNSTFPVKLFVDSTRSGGMRIDNLYHSGVGQTVDITVSGRTIYIPNQEFCDNLFSVNGDGSIISDNKIDLIFYVNTGPDLDTVNATLSR